MIDKKITAVEWFEQQLDDLDIEIPFSIFEQAKQMGKEQIIDAYIDGVISEMIFPLDRERYKEQAEQYYKENYEKK